MLKIAIDGNFYLFLERKLIAFSKLASAKFNAWKVNLQLSPEPYCYFL